jgi:hypothetical protein
VRQIRLFLPHSQSLAVILQTRRLEDRSRRGFCVTRLWCCARGSKLPITLDAAPNAIGHLNRQTIAGEASLRSIGELRGRPIRRRFSSREVGRCHRTCRLKNPFRDHARKAAQRSASRSNVEIFGPYPLRMTASQGRVVGMPQTPVRGKACTFCFWYRLQLCTL